ncbi:MAG TPA: T9SS type A sorting domain-containing protein, partial [Bacteroidia bacterium]|nr:T9SS type A sorting domain-containing protein [Bacteroidia bacterium]
YTVVGTTNGCKDSATFVVNAVVGIENITDGNSISLYPNPVMNVMNITFTTSTGTTNALIRVIDMLGNEISTSNTTITNGRNIRMDVTSLPQGVYFVQVVTDKSTQVVRFIKQ